VRSSIFDMTVSSKGLDTCCSREECRAANCTYRRRLGRWFERRSGKNPQAIHSTEVPTFEETVANTFLVVT
jgi:hypothetical protein